MSYKETVEDLDRKYARSFIGYKGQPALIESFQKDGDKMMVGFMCQGDRVWKYEPWENGDFTDPILTHGFYNVRDPVVKAPIGYVYFRRPQRQYRRGICNDNSELVSPIKTINPLMDLYGHNGALSLEDFNVVKRLFEPEFPKDFETAFEWTKSCGVVALCPEFGLMLSPNTEDDSAVLVVNRNNHFIGEIKDGIFRVYFNPFLQEAQDVVRRRNLNLTVVDGT